MPHMIIANRLTDGRVVFMTAARDWATDITAGQVADDGAAADALLAQSRQHEANNCVIDPCLIEVQLVDGVPQPLAYREYIRAFGPSVPLPA